MRIWKHETRFAFLLTPNAAIREVTQVPMLQPMTIGKAMLHVRVSSCENVMSIPIEPAEL